MTARNRIELSQPAAKLHPDLSAALNIYRPNSGDIRIVADGETDGDVIIARGAPDIATCSTTKRLRLTFGATQTEFAAALIATAARGEARPAGIDPASVALLGLAAKVAPCDIGVLIAGPTGTGKEGLARFLHARSPRRSGPFVAVNCAAIPETMLEATLFGYERGAFTGAATSAPGLFRAAAGGTLLLDEVSELPLVLQAKLLRAIQEREVLPVGATMPIRIDARIVATANRNLADEVTAGRFREDLFYRLAVFPLTTTPLAKRRADIVPITAALWLRQGIAAWPTTTALTRLVKHRWPGNVRELGNVIARAAVFAEGSIVSADDIIFDVVTSSASITLSGSMREQEFATIRSALAASAGKRRVAAERLGISERTLRYKLAAMANASATLQ